MIRLILADDQMLLTGTLKALLERNKTLEVVACVEDGEQAVNACSVYNPDIILMDIHMPRMNGIDATHRIKELNPQIKVIILTTFDQTSHIFESIIAGADGYIVKDLESEELIRAVDCVYNGLHVVHHSVYQLMAKEFKRLYQNKNVINLYGNSITLTQIELDIIAYVARGRSNREIADVLGFTEGSIKNKITKLFEKLGLDDRTQIAVFAIENNII